MPISATGNSSPVCITPAPAANLPARSRASAEAGFSLTEVLVTLSIIAFTSAMILGTSRPADPLRQEVERLAATLAQLEHRARISGEPTGLIINADSYVAAVWNGEEWIALPRSARTLSKGVVISPPAPIPAPRDTLPDTEKRTQPQIAFDPLGHSALTDIELRAGGRQMAVPISAGSGS